MATGIFRLDVAGVDWQEALCCALQSDGKIIVAGTMNFNTGTQWNPDTSNANINTHFLPYLIRLNTDGTLDTSFGISGFNNLDWPGVGALDAEGTDVKVLADDSILLPFVYYVPFAGGTGSFSGYNGIAKFTKDGILDTTFGTSGMTLIARQGTTYADIVKVGVLSDGKILLAGNIGVSGGGCNVFCLTPSGAINNGWGNQFGQIFAPGVGDGSYGATNLRSLLVLPNDKVMVGTIYHSDQSTTEFGIQRGTSAGLIDAGWGTKDSTAIISPPITGIATPYGGMLQEPVTGNIIVGGWMPYDGTGNGAVSLFRLNASDGSLDTSFGTSSGFTNTHFGPNAYDQTASGSMFYDADGNIVIGGTSGTTNPGAGYHLPNFLFMICRYTSNGIPDTTFSATGAIYIDITGLGASDNQTVYGSLCQADGKYIFCGHYHSAFAHGSGHAGGSKLWVIRTSSAGVLDATFGEPSPVVAQRKTLSTIGTRSSSRKVQH